MGDDDDDDGRRGRCDKRALRAPCARWIYVDLPQTTMAGLKSHLDMVKEVTAFVECMEAAPDPYVMVVEECGVVDDALVAAFAKLMPQLSKTSPPPDAAALEALVRHDATTLITARTAHGVVGVLTLVVFPIPTGTRAWIEDVVVDEDARGCGLGGRLLRHAVDCARRAGAKTLDLTSRPSREAANRLYRRVGFEIRETNVYRMDLRAAAS